MKFQYELGLSFKLNEFSRGKTTFKPYLEYKTKGNADDDYEKKHLIFATALPNFKF